MGGWQPASIRYGQLHELVNVAVKCWKCVAMARSHFFALLTGACALVAPPGRFAVPSTRLQSLAEVVVQDPTMGATLLSPFAQQINDELEKRFGAAETARVREAWRLMDVDYVHKEALIEGHEYMKQEARSYLPGLTPMPFWDLTTTAWAQELEANWEVVRDEFRAVAMDDADNLKKKGNNVWVAAADSDSAASYGPDWRTLVLMDRTTWDPTNCNLFPKTAKLLSDAGVPCVEAFFASMTPNSKIAPHTDSCEEFSVETVRVCGAVCAAPLRLKLNASRDDREPFVLFVRVRLLHVSENREPVTAAREPIARMRTSTRRAATQATSCSRATSAWTSRWTATSPSATRRATGRTARSRCSTRRSSTTP